MMSEIKLILFLTFVFLAGKALLDIIIREKQGIAYGERVALSFGLGIGSIPLGMFYLSYLGIDLNLLNVVILFSPLIAYSIIKSRNSIKLINLKNLNLSFSVREYIVILLLIFIALLIFADAMSRPLDQWDDRAFWGLKAKIIYHDATIYSPDFFDPDRLHPHKQYPLLIPLAESMIFFTLGQMDDRLVKVIFPIFFTSLLIIFYYSQRKFFPRLHSLCFTALLASLPFLLVTALPIPDTGKGPSSGYVDTPLAFFYFVASIYLYLWFFKPQKMPYIILSSVFLAFVIFSKTEGLFLYLIDFFVFLVFIFFNNRLNYRNMAFSSCFLLLPIIILFPWFAYQSNLPSDTEIRFSFDILRDHLERLPVILQYFVFNYWHPLHWNLIFPLLIVSTILAIKNILENDILYLYILLLLNIFSFIIMYLLSMWTPIDVHLYSSLDRMTTHIIPIAIFLLSSNIYFLSKKKDVD